MAPLRIIEATQNRINYEKPQNIARKAEGRGPGLGRTMDADRYTVADMAVARGLQLHGPINWLPSRYVVFW